METRLPLRWWPWWSATPARGGTRPHALELRGDLGWRAPAVVFLAVIAALHVVMGVAVFEASSPGSERLAIADDGKDEPDIAHRPSLPLHPEQMAADIEDEEADPVIDSGPGIADDTRGPH